ncbi:enoyl-CoA hydratase-related protein [Geoalkalibacter sp.]|uniref:enoyl-CoA hydratase-related protein n=1 Tax=Geoalkalibacter sp. TaxID=3041440 RepID=UPI00272E53C9|nr:enoyl-CoA hydratase-related protein [Geoalkalibacter sp.]
MRLPQLIDSSLEIVEGVAVLTLRRDDVRNALTGTALVEDVIAAVDWANRSPQVSVLVLTGEGAAFSSGGNVKDMQERSGMFAGDVLAIQDNYRRGIQRLPLALHEAEVPIIAAVNGPAIGAGMDLACMCDLRLGSCRALFGETFVNLGIVSGDGGAWFLQRLIGYQKAAELCLTGRTVDAAEALTLGLLLEVTEPEDLLRRALELAARIAAKPRPAVRLTKRLLKLAQHQELADFLKICACFQSMAHHSQEHLEAVTAFLEGQAKRRAAP